MDNSLKQRIHALVEDESNEEMLQAVYQLLNESEYTEDFKAVLNEEQADYYKKKEAISEEDMKVLIDKILKK